MSARVFAKKDKMTRHFNGVMSYNFFSLGKYEICISAKSSSSPRLITWIHRLLFLSDKNGTSSPRNTLLNYLHTFLYKIHVLYEKFCCLLSVREFDAFKMEVLI